MGTLTHLDKIIPWGNNNNSNKTFITMITVTLTRIIMLSSVKRRSPPNPSTAIEKTHAAAHSPIAKIRKLPCFFFFRLLHRIHHPALKRVTCLSGQPCDGTWPLKLCCRHAISEAMACDMWIQTAPVLFKKKLSFWMYEEMPPLGMTHQLPTSSANQRLAKSRNHPRVGKPGVYEAFKYPYAPCGSERRKWTIQLHMFLFFN